MNDLIRQRLSMLPSVSLLLEDDTIATLCNDYGRNWVVSIIRTLLDNKRVRIRAGEELSPLLEGSIVQEVSEYISRELLKRMCPAVNATGTILHTNLGRAPLADQAIEAICQNARYTNLELDRLNGERNHREEYFCNLLQRITGCESSVLVNNNAAATLLSITALCSGKEVIVARGQIVEIGGSFRLHEIILQSGARLVEVGATNKVRLSDYENAITENTAALLHVHPSNYSIEGFYECASVKELAELAKKHNILCINDLGSGSLYPLSKFGLKDEPLVQDSIKDGAHITLFSADKLIGGPQGGIIIGKEQWVFRIRRHPLFRPMRPCKLTLSALCATLELYIHFEKNYMQIPFYYYLSRSTDEVKATAYSASDNLKNTEYTVVIKECFSQVGSGSLPTAGIPGWCAYITHPSLSAERLARFMRTAPTPVYGRIIDNCYVLDFRTVGEADALLIVDLLKEAQKKFTDSGKESQ